MPENHESRIFHVRGIPMRKNNDVFDRLMAKPYMARFRHYYNRYKEMLLYAFFGGGTVLINVIVYSVLTEAFFWGILVANAVAWLFATLFAFFTNRTWVFASHARGVKAFCLQLWSFSFGRFITLMIEEGMLYYFVGCLHGHNVSVKLVAQVVVIVANYFVSKLIVFRRKR